MKTLAIYHNYWILYDQLLQENLFHYIIIEIPLLKY